MAQELLKKFDQLMSHLNGEENGMAEEFRKALEASEEQAYENGLWRSCLENGGVDNWSWYSESLSEYFEYKESKE